MRPDPGRGSEIFRLPLGNGCVRFLLRYSTMPTMATAPTAEPTTMPALAPVDRLVTLEEVDELLLADDDEAAAAAPVVVELELALVAEPVRVVIPLAAVSVADACSIVSHDLSSPIAA